MVQFYKTPLFLLIAIFCFSGLSAQNDTIAQYIKDHYTKAEVKIPMRDGIKLHASVYAPKDQSRTYPIIMTRTPYSAQPYGEDAFPTSPYRMAANKHLLEEGNIFVVQDVRGRWMSEGDYDNMRPFIPHKKGKQTDEASDTYDTIDWLVKNIKNNNGNVGIWGISYPGFYSTYSLLSGHPALKAVSPQASISDFFFDDFHHNGAYMLSYFMATGLFGQQFEPTTNPDFHFPNIPSKDAYGFLLENTPIEKLDRFYPDNFFWDQLRDHPNYDDFWQSRGILQHLKDTKPAVMVVGGLFDAEDLYGPFQTYDRIEANSDNYNILAVGPWNHGQWVDTAERQAVGNIYFGDSISLKFQEEVVTPFFNHFLKGEGNIDHFPEAYLYDSGKREWNSYAQWPPQEAQTRRFYLGKQGKLSTKADPEYKNEFVSDVTKPVPYNENSKFVFTPRNYMTGDQRFAARRPDVLTFETEILEEDFKLVGEIKAVLETATTGTDADWVVKLVDVFPHDIEDYPEMEDRLSLSNYHMMVRSEVMPAQFRNSFSEPEALVPKEKTTIEFALQGVNHTFKKGHKIQIQVQSTWFPLINLNPQTFVPNIFKASESDYQNQTHTLFGDSFIEFKQLN